MAEKIVDPSRRRDIPRAARAAAVADLALAAGHRAAARRRRRTPYWGGRGIRRDAAEAAAVGGGAVGGGAGQQPGRRLPHAHLQLPQPNPRFDSFVVLRLP